MTFTRWVSLAAAAGLFIWMLVLFTVGATVSATVEVSEDGGVTSRTQDIACDPPAELISDGPSDWPLDEDGERSAALSTAVDEAHLVCDSVRQARSTQATLLAVPAAVLGVYALCGAPRRRGAAQPDSGRPASFRPGFAPEPPEAASSPAREG